MPKGSIVVNTARGEVVDESALVAAIKSGHLFAAALDTMQTEPLPLNSPLRNLPNVILTPHVAGSTPAAITAMAYGAADIVMRALHGHPIDRSSCVNPEVLPEV